MFKFFLCALLSATSFIECSFPDADLQLNSPLSIASTKLPGNSVKSRSSSTLSIVSAQPSDDVSSFPLRVKPNASLNFDSIKQQSQYGTLPLEGTDDAIDELRLHTAVVMDTSQDQQCMCVINTENKYCKATLCVLGYLTAIGGVGGIITAIIHAT